MSLTADVNADLKNAIALHQRGQLGDAEPIYRKILQTAPHHFDAQHLLGVLKHQHGRNDEAAELIAAALEQRPNEAVALANYGAVLNALRRFAETIASCDKAIALKPDYPEAFNNRGVALKELGRTKEALTSYDKAIALRPTYAEAFNNRGIVLRELKRTSDALASYDRAIALRPTYAEAYNNRGVALAELKRFDEALVNYATAITLKRGYAEAYNNSGAALYLLKRHDEARNCYDQAIACDAHYAKAHWNKAQLTLLLGDFAHGWAEYEWRWKIAPAAQDFVRPLWRGDGAIAGKTILLHSEQGFGDTIQFCRYAPLVAERGARVILEVQSPLKRLMADLPGVTQVIAKGEPRPAYDFHCPLLSLPLAFGTRLDTIPSSPRLRAPAESMIDWTARPEPDHRPRIGLVWSGNAAHKRDQDRSIALRAMLPLLGIDATFVSLQKEVREDDAAVLKERNDILDLRDRLGDFSDTAALMSQLDLVISVDTSVAHLAGALGKPVWVLLNDVPDWRWLLDRDDSPWYPTARLFRQDATCDWDKVIARVRDALQEFTTSR